MRRDAVSAGLDREQRRAHRIGITARPRIAEGSDVIDIDAEAQRRSFRHGVLADRVTRTTRTACAGPTRASIFLERMESRVKPELAYPLTRSTRATTALARNWAI